MEEDKNDSSLSYAEIDDDKHDDSINTLGNTAKKVANVIRKSLGSGAKGSREKSSRSARSHRCKTGRD